jgi:tetratricopeptide (TPR) repeat protein
MKRRRKPRRQQQDTPARPGRFGRLLRTPKARWLLAAVALGAVGIGVSAAWVLWPAHGRRPTVAPASPAQAEIAALQEEALQAASHLREDYPDSSDPLVLMGNLYSSVGNSAEATKCWQHALEMDPERADAYRGLGSLAMRKGEYQKALDLWHKALKIEPEMTGIGTLSARALMALGRPKEAIAALQQDIRISPRASTSYFELGQAYRQLKEYEKAKEAYLAATSIQPDYTNAYYGLAVTCERLGEKHEVALYMEKFRELKAENRRTERDSRSRYDDVASARQSVAETHTDAGQVYYGHGNLREAEQHWRRAAQLDPQNTTCRMQLVRVYMQGNKDREALQICEELRRIDPTDAVTHLNIGVLCARLNRFDAALAAMDRAIALDPGNAEYQRARQQIEERKRRGRFGG